MLRFVISFVALAGLLAGCSKSRCAPGEVPFDALQGCAVPKVCDAGMEVNERNQCERAQGSTAEPDAAAIHDAADDIASATAGSSGGASGFGASALGAAGAGYPTSGRDASGASGADAGASGSGAAGASAPEPHCGDGIRQGNELCDGTDCESTCMNSNACLVSTPSGSAATCDATCSKPIEISECRSGDGCCAKGCTYATDPDCSKGCGDGVVDAPELCEPTSRDKPCPALCDDGDPCTMDIKTGTPEQCNVACSHMAITSPVRNDGCCPPEASVSTDSDCAARCGDGVVSAGETCEPNSKDKPCPTSCEDGDDCTEDAIVGDAISCTSKCSHTKVAHTGPETAADCEDSNPCTKDAVVQTNSCTSKCSYTMVAHTGPSSAAECDDGDPCTTESVVQINGCTSTCDRPRVSAGTSCGNGRMCTSTGLCELPPAECGNGTVELGEECEESARSSGTDGLAAGTVYDEWSCDANSCKRRYALTPCSNGSDCGSAAGVRCNSSVVGGLCTAACNFDAPFVPNATDPNRYNCLFPSGQHGLCFSQDNCIPLCKTDGDCPRGVRCAPYATFMICDTTGNSTVAPP